MNVLVTGCSGFVGWKVSELLHQQGHMVLGVDNQNGAYDVNLKQWRLSQLQQLSNFRFLSLDVTRRSEMCDYFSSLATSETGRIDAVINLAARAGIRQSLEDPWAYFETNVNGTLNLLELCRTYGIGKFILASTSSVYGNSKVPFHEEMPAERPLSPYGASKKAAEALCYAYHSLYGLDVTVFRYFTVYGPAGRPDMSIFRFIQWITERELVTVFGDGSAQRDFTYVDDIARGTVLGLKPLGYEIINLGSDRPVAVREIIRQLEKLLGRTAEVKHVPRHSADVLATHADISRARDLLDWKPSNSIEDGLAKTVAWHQENRDWVKSVQVEQG